MNPRHLNHVSAFATIAATLGLLSFGLVAPAMATPVTFNIEGGALTITVPTATAALGNVFASTSAAQSVTGALGAVSVDDSRSPLVVGWVATVVSSAFTGTNGISGTNGTVAASNVSYTVGTVTPGGTASAANLTVANQSNISSDKPVVTATNLTGYNSASWDPSITVNIPAGTVAGNYAGTVTHSVA